MRDRLGFFGKYILESVDGEHADEPQENAPGVAKAVERTSRQEDRASFLYRMFAAVDFYGAGSLQDVVGLCGSVTVGARDVFAGRRLGHTQGELWGRGAIAAEERPPGNAST